jgi:hypothetical protein
MQEVAIRRTDYREHVFTIPDDVEIGSDRYDEIIQDYDWHDTPIYHSDLEINHIKEGAPCPA